MIQYEPFSPDTLRNDTLVILVEPLEIDFTYKREAPDWIIVGVFVLALLNIWLAFRD